MAEQNLLKRYVDEGDTRLGYALETKEGREIYAEAREAVESEDIFSVYDAAYNELLDWYSLTPDHAKIIAWGMVQKALTDLIHKELSE